MSSWKASKENIMSEELYCIECGKVVNAEEGLIFGHIVYVPIYGDRGEVVGVDVDFCEFPKGFTYCPPPPVDPDWIEDVVEQGSNELDVDLDSLELDYSYELKQMVEA